MKNKPMRINYAVEQRLRFIDFLVLHYGYVTRRALVDYFGISGSCATHDFKLYQEQAPDNLTYNLSTKRYEGTTSFEPLFGIWRNRNEGA